VEAAEAWLGPFLLLGAAHIPQCQNVAETWGFWAMGLNSDEVVSPRILTHVPSVLLLCMGEVHCLR
jgi:hypothetical protein